MSCHLCHLGVIVKAMEMMSPFEQEIYHEGPVLSPEEGAAAAVTAAANASSEAMEVEEEGESQAANTDANTNTDDVEAQDEDETMLFGDDVPDDDEELPAADNDRKQSDKQEDMDEKTDSEEEADESDEEPAGLKVSLTIRVIDRMLSMIPCDVWPDFKTCSSYWQVLRRFEELGQAQHDYLSSQNLFYKMFIFHSGDACGAKDVSQYIKTDKLRSKWCKRLENFIVLFGSLAQDYQNKEISSSESKVILNVNTLIAMAYDHIDEVSVGKAVAALSFGRPEFSKLIADKINHKLDQSAEGDYVWYLNVAYQFIAIQDEHEVYRVNELLTGMLKVCSDYLQFKQAVKICINWIEKFSRTQAVRKWLIENFMKHKIFEILIEEDLGLRKATCALVRSCLKQSPELLDVLLPSLLDQGLNIAQDRSNFMATQETKKNCVYHEIKSFRLVEYFGLLEELVAGSDELKAKVGLYIPTLLDLLHSLITDKVNRGAQECNFNVKACLSLLNAITQQHEGSPTYVYIYL